MADVLAIHAAVLNAISKSTDGIKVSTTTRALLGDATKAWNSMSRGARNPIVDPVAALLGAAETEMDESAKAIHKAIERARSYIASF